MPHQPLNVIQYTTNQQNKRFCTELEAYTKNLKSSDTHPSTRHNYRYIGRSLNSRDSFPGWKFKNWAPTSCSPGPILWPPTISFELHAEMAEIDLEKCTFHNFGSSVTLTLTLDRVEVTLVRIRGRGLPTNQIRWKSEKVFVDVRMYGRTDGRTPEFQSTRSSPRR